MFDLRRPARLFDPVFLGKAGQEITEQIFVALSGADFEGKNLIFYKAIFDTKRNGQSSNICQKHQLESNFV
jgi:hypothetical protein